MQYVIVRVECPVCGKHRGAMASAEGFENELKCFYCNSDLVIKSILLKIGKSHENESRDRVPECR